MARALMPMLAVAVVTAACASCTESAAERITISGSAVGDEARALRQQLDRFVEAHPGWDVELRPTPDAADQRHQLYVQWLNAHAAEPDVLQLDTIWTAEFSAAGWILPLDRFDVDVDAFFAPAIAANRWQGRLYAVPWFIDVGMLYWRTDLLPGPPQTFEALREAARQAMKADLVRYGLIWQGARYEGLVTVFLEYLGAAGGVIVDPDGHVVVDSDEGVAALTRMVDDVRGPKSVVPTAALAWQEEQVRFAFQNGEALFMRNWPYAAALLADPAQSRVAGRFGVAAMPADVGGRPTAALGGAQLAINRYSRHPERAYALIKYLTAPEQMIERVHQVGQLPARVAVYDDPNLERWLAAPPAELRAVVERAVARPATPVYAELSEVLQVGLHSALTGQETPRAALTRAAESMRQVLRRSGLTGPSTQSRGSHMMGPSVPVRRVGLAGHVSDCGVQCS